MNIEKEIRKILLDEDIEIKELARRLNTSQQNISAKLKRNNFTTKDIEKILNVLGYELKTAVGTSVFIMAFTAFTGAMSHFVIGGVPDFKILILCMVFTFVGAQVSAKFANKSSEEVLNRVLGIVLCAIGTLMVVMNMIA